MDITCKFTEYEITTMIRQSKFYEMLWDAYDRRSAYEFDELCRALWGESPARQREREKWQAKHDLPETGKGATE